MLQVARMRQHGANVQVQMLNERQSTLTRLTLRVCDTSEYDPDVPLIFDLQPLAQASAVIRTLCNLEPASPKR